SDRASFLVPVQRSKSTVPRTPAWPDGKSPAAVRSASGSRADHSLDTRVAVADEDQRQPLDAAGGATPGAVDAFMPANGGLPVRRGDRSTIATFGPRAGARRRERMLRWSLMSDAAKPSNFIREIIEEHIRTGRFGGKVVTRFPPEPNGYLHIGHAKAICIDFGLARDYGGRCHLRFDDTNPTKESQEYVDAIMNDVRWLGFDWAEHLHHASDYFEQLYRWAEQLITAGKAYVDDQTAEELRETRGTLTGGGRPSPFRDRAVAENLDLFRRMRAGEFPDGSKTLRAKIDMTS